MVAMTSLNTGEVSATALMLHDDHMEKLRFANNLNQIIAKYDGASAPDPGDRQVTALGAEVKAHFGRLPDPHFAFEEDILFPILAENGAGDLQEMLCAEHRDIEAAGVDLLKSITQGLDLGFDRDSWAEFRTRVMALVPLMTDHIEKEEAAFPDLIADALDPDDDRQIAMDYAGNR